MLVLSGPWLLLGLIVAGLIHEWLSTSLVTREISKPGLGSILKAGLFGLPLPLCSCSVIPVGLSLRRAGASRGATTSFFISTPEIGIDSFFLSYVLLGPWMAIARAVAAFVSAVLAGVSVDLFCSETTNSLEDSETSKEGTSNEGSCCSSKSETSAAASPGLIGRGFISRLKRALRFGFVDLLDDFSKLLVIGFLLAGFISAAVPADWFQQVSLSAFGYASLMLLISLPMYVCSVASTPIAAALLLKGVPEGAVLVFLLAGPASNITTMLVLRRELGSKALALYLLSVVGVAMALATAIDYGFIESLIGSSAAAGMLSLSLEHAHHSLSGTLFALALCLLLAWSIVRQLKPTS